MFEIVSLKHNYEPVSAEGTPIRVKQNVVKLASDNQVVFSYFRELFTANSSATSTPAATVEGRNPATLVPLPAGTRTISTVAI